MSASEPGVSCPAIGRPSIAEMSKASPAELEAALPAAAWCAQPSEETVGTQSGDGEELQGGEDAAVDLAGLDGTAPAAGGEGDVGVAQQLALELGL